MPHLILVPLDVALAQQAVEVAAQHRLRGSGAVYAAVALRFGSPLVTLGRERRGQSGFGPEDVGSVDPEYLVSV